MAKRKPITFKRVETGQIDDMLTVYVYGPPGVGKTYLAGTAHPMQRVYIALAEAGGERSLAELLRSEPNRQVFSTQITNTDDLFAFVEEIERLNIEEPNNAPQWVVIDSVTELAQFDLAERKGIGDLDAKGDKHAMRSYMGMQDSVMHCLRRLKAASTRGAKFNMLAIFHEGDKPEAGYEGRLGPAIPGKQATRQVAYVADILGRLAMHPVKNPDGSTTEQRALQVQPTQLHEGKDRTGKLGSVCRPRLDFIEWKANGRLHGVPQSVLDASRKAKERSRPNQDAPPVVEEIDE